MYTEHENSGALAQHNSSLCLITHLETAGKEKSVTNQALHCSIQILFQTRCATKTQTRHFTVPYKLCSKHFALQKHKPGTSLFHTNSVPNTLRYKNTNQALQCCIQTLFQTPCATKTQTRHFNVPYKLCSKHFALQKHKPGTSMLHTNSVPNTLRYKNTNQALHCSIQTLFQTLCATKHFANYTRDEFTNERKSSCRIRFWRQILSKT
jgi:hypothetical protein